MHQSLRQHSARFAPLARIRMNRRRRGVSCVMRVTSALRARASSWRRRVLLARMRMRARSTATPSALTVRSATSARAEAARRRDATRGRTRRRREWMHASRVRPARVSPRQKRLPACRAWLDPFARRGRARRCRVLRAPTAVLPTWAALMNALLALPATSARSVRSMRRRAERARMLPLIIRAGARSVPLART